MLRALSLASLLVLSACDSTSAIDDSGNPTPSDTRTPVDRTPNTDALGALSVSFGRAGAGSVQGAFGSLSYPQDLTDGVLSFGESNFWLSGTQGGEARVTGRRGPRRCSDADTQTYLPVFSLAADVDYGIGSWPVALGAPVEADGTPRVYGDYMQWEVYCTPEAPEAQILRDLRVEAAVFMHKDLERVRFVRFEITNTGTTAISDLRAGFYADLDVGGAGYSNNFVGVDGPMTYAYMRQNYDGQDGHPSALGGMRILQSPDNQQPVQRVIYRNAGPGEPAILGEAGFSNDMIRKALRGLANDGSPILNPVTAAVTTRMYTGDPVAGTGWLDGSLSGGENGWDIRTVAASGPATLAPGASTVLTVAFVAGQGADLAASRTYARTTLDAIAAQPALWTFPTDDDAPARQ